MAPRVPSFELESGDLNDDLLEEIAAKRKSCWIFPLEVLICLPSSVRGCIPKQFHYFQGWIHIWLFLGVISCCFLVAHSAANVYKTFFQGKKLEYSGVQEAIEFILPLPCLYYFMTTLGQYDDDLHKKKAMAEAARQKLIDAYTDTLDDMSEILDHAAEVNAGFAERSFENKRRDFIRFLERWHQKFGGMSSMSPEISKHLHEQLKRFIQNWFNAFAECSIDAMRAPNRPVSEAELEKCQTMEELCSLCIYRLKQAEVKFIAAQMEKDNRLLEDSKKQLQAVTFVGQRISGTVYSKKKANPWALATDVVGDVAGMAKKQVGYLTGISWCVFGCKRRETYKIEAGLVEEDGFPRLIPFGCGIIVILSPGHVVLLLGFLAGWVMLALELFFPHTKKRMVALLSVFEFTVTLTLIRFEKIDILQRLTREANNVRKEKEALQERHQKMKKFWTQAQQQTDLWLHRTVPRLDLYSEIHGKLEDMDAELAYQGMDIANTKLEELQSCLGPLEYWFTDGVLTDKHKKNFDESIANACIEPDFRQLMIRLDGVNESVKAVVAQSHGVAQSQGKAARKTQRVKFIENDA